MAKVRPKIAVCQICCVNSDVEGNLDRVEELVEQAAALGADIACFPETVIIGWVNSDAHRLAETIPGPHSERIGQIARKHKTPVCISLTERTDGGIYDSAIIVWSNGEVVHKHRKISTLAELLKPPYLQGEKDDVRAVDTPLGRIGVMICADSFSERHREIMAGHKCDWIWIPYGWAAPKDAWPDHGKNLASTVCANAKAARAPIVGPNSVGEITTGPWAGRTFEGLSAVADADGEVIAVGEHNVQQVFIADLN